MPPTGSMRRRRELHSSDFDFNDHRERHAVDAERLRAAAREQTVDARDLDAAAVTVWDAFYVRHAGRFFKPRYFILEAFPELAARECVFEVGVGNGSNIVPLLEGSAVSRLLVCDIAPGALTTLGHFGARVVPFLWNAATGRAPEAEAVPLCEDATASSAAPDAGAVAQHAAPDSTGQGSITGDRERDTVGVSASMVAAPLPSAPTRRPGRSRSPPRGLPEETLDLLRRTRGAPASAVPPSWLSPPPEVTSSCVDAALLMFVLSAVHPDRHADSVRNVALVRPVVTAPALAPFASPDRLLPASPCRLFGRAGFCASVTMATSTSRSCVHLPPPS